MTVPKATPRPGWFANLLAGIREGQTLARRYDEFARLSNADLARRGFSRRDVCRLVARDCARARYFSGV